MFRKLLIYFYCFVLCNLYVSLDSQKSQELSRVADALTLLDHCHSHVIIDKALQSALLVLENNNITQRCHDIQKQKNVLEDENEALRKQIQSLQQEAVKLNGKLNETSTTLCVVKKSKEKLEDDLSSVFQLHNMRNSERNEKEKSFASRSFIVLVTLRIFVFASQASKRRNCSKSTGRTLLWN